jgi:D-serine deaminase-like pyridoxal phosphate-dependent protein
MNLRQLVLGTAAAAAGALWITKPSNRGEPYDDYFRALNAELKREGPMRPCLVIDLDRMDQNLERVATALKRSGKHYRIVEKSLPSQKLIEYVMRKADTKRLMSFHEPFLNSDVIAFADADILLGKPLPVRSAELFYKKLKGPFDPSRQLQWLLDTPERLQQYLDLANGLETKLRANIEIDVGLHRGGVHDDATLARMLDIIAAQPRRLELAGFLGYDAHVGLGVPRILGTPRRLLDKAMAIYQARVDFTRSRYPKLWNDTLTLNSGGSPSYQLHEHERVSNDIAVGTALLKPTHYDIETLTDHVPAVFIATPVIKSTGPIQLPVLDEKSRIFSWWDPNQRQTYFIYGGWWRAQYESPKGLQFNARFGHSANQEIVNGSPTTGLDVDDQVFLRPRIVEGVLLQFGDLVAMRGGRIVDYWPPLTG